MSDANRAVFLSYASQDTDAALRICEALRLEGIEVWFDQSALRGGEAWDQSIRRQIRDCALFVPIISAHTQGRREGYFRLEWKLADERTHLMAEGTPLILPVVVDHTKDRDALVPKSFLAVQWSWLPQGEVPAAFVVRVQKLLGPQRSVGTDQGSPHARESAEPPAAETRHRATTAAPAGNRRPNLGVLVPWTLVLVLGATSAWLAIRSGPVRNERSNAATAPVVAHAIIALPPQAPLAPTRAFPFGLSQPSLALSPDGTNLVYVAHVGQTTQLYLRPLDQPEAKPIAETEGAYHPFFSPDGRWVGFFAADKVKKVSVLGGAPITLCDSGNELKGGAWADDGRIYFAPEGILNRVNESGGPAELVSDKSGASYTVSMPEAIPGANGLLGLFSTGLSPNLSGDFRAIEFLSLRSNEKMRVVERGYSPRFLSPGQIVFARGGSLHAATFDLQRRAAGEAVPVLTGVMTDALSKTAQFAVSARGSLVFAAGGAQDRSVPVWVDRAGKAQALPIEPRTFGELKLSPDGSRFSVMVGGVTDNLWIFDVATGQGAPLDEPGQNLRGLWTNDSKRFIFSSGRSGKPGLYWKAIDGSEPRASLLYESKEPDAYLVPAACLPNENKLALVTHSRGAWKAFTLTLDGSGKTEPMVGGGDAWFVQFSRDGQWICFTANRSGRSEVYVQRYPSGSLTQISFDGGEEALWSPQGDEIFYRNRDTWMSVSVTTEPIFKAGVPREMFRGPYLNVPGYSQAVAPDGRRFLMLKPEQPDTPVTQLHLILNWAETVRRRVANVAQQKASD